MTNANHIASRIAAVLFALSPASGALAEEVAPAVFAPMIAAAEEPNLSARPLRVTEIVAQLSQDNDSRPATQGDLRVVKSDISTVKTDLLAVKTDLGAVKTDLGAVKTDLRMVQEDLRQVQKDVHVLQGDVRQIEERMARMEVQMDHMRAEMREDFRWIIATIIALLGLPQLPNWINRLRGNGKAPVAS